MAEEKISSSKHDAIVDELLGEFKTHREAIQTMIGELEVLKDKVDTLFPEKLDQRYMRFFEDKVKATTSFFNALLDMRKEFAKTLKDEIEIRRRIIKDGGGADDILEDIEELLDIRKMADKVEKFKKSLKPQPKPRAETIENPEEKE